MNRLSDTLRWVGIYLILSFFGILLGYENLDIVKDWIITILVTPLALLILMIFIDFSRQIRFYIYTICSILIGLATSITVAQYISISGIEIVLQAIVLTFTLVVGLGYYAYTTKNNHMNLGKFLFWATIALIIVSIIVIIFFNSSISQVILSSISALIFSLWIIYDIQLIKHSDEDPIDIGFAIFLDIIILFKDLLVILGFIDE